jgi:hypothetical protein
MDTFAVAVLPIVNVDEWLKFLRETTNGERAEAHRDFLRRAGVAREHVFRQRTPNGDLMVLVWEGIDSEQQATHMANVFADPQSEHERYMRDYALPRIHGFDPSQPPPPPVEKMATNET